MSPRESPGSSVRRSAMDQVPAVMRVAETWANLRSKAGTKVGAAVYDRRTGEMFLGYNGFPPGFPDLDSIWNGTHPVLSKHDLIVHAEANAVMKAIAAKGRDLSGCTLVCTLMPCSRCMRSYVLATGIKTVVYESTAADMLTEKEIKIVRTMATLGSVQLVQLWSQA